MPVGLITNSSAGGFVRKISASTSNVDLFDLFDSPIGAVKYTLLISSGVLVDSVNSVLPSISAIGFSEAAVGLWIVDGDITGAGGRGGDGGVYSGGDILGGGGGGGAGAVVGLGGAGIPPATDGDPGTATTGGAGGNTVSGSETPETATAGGAGGHAISLNHSITITLSGTIAGGGGGGAGSESNVVTIDGGDGGDLGNNGSAAGSVAGGLRGSAVKYSGSADATINGGTVIGDVG